MFLCEDCFILVSVEFDQIEKKTTDALICGMNDYKLCDRLHLFFK